MFRLGSIRRTDLIHDAKGQEGVRQMIRKAGEAAVQDEAEAVAIRGAMNRQPHSEALPPQNCRTLSSELLL